MVRQEAGVEKPFTKIDEFTTPQKRIYRYC